jgi:hypothetical protein
VAEVTRTIRIDAATAARNNAAWCDAVCEAHGRPGEVTSSLWWTRSAAPPLYPNLVTLDRSREPALSAVRALDAAGLGSDWSVKDSFAVLPLDRHGFTILFDAEWIVAPVHRRPVSSRRGRWTKVDSKAALERWETAWGESAGRPRIFLPGLLRRDDVAILAGCDGEATVAGVIANRTDGVVGISNLFAPRHEPVAWRAACVDAVRERFPGMPVVGYETGAWLDEALAAGCETLGRLRVWIKTAPG